MWNHLEKIFIEPVIGFKKNNTQTLTILLAALFIMLSGNVAMFSRILNVYPFQPHNVAFLTSLFVFFSALTMLFLLVVSHGKFTRWVLAFFLIAAAFAAYYMDQFGVIIDGVMLDNITQTDMREFNGLVTPLFALRVILLGLFPAWLVVKYTPKPRSIISELKSRGIAIGALILLLVVVVLPFIAGNTSFIREHRVTRFYANPTYFTYSAIKFVQEQFKSEPSQLV